MIRVDLLYSRCPGCGGAIDVKAQDRVEGNFYYCSKCGTILYR